ncbi:hypothetical protein COU74_00800 [Candidatus Peregrinibacteria bacterium CG10_big_fil_rev_8_21_14_0_10_36_19]|nr:MAG: hypothetical protein COU74_00800 [Candidatus Peregrinibacteria bacterium CG10_big_fil_rev_8_21_14_0_10_36_19]
MWIGYLDTSFNEGSDGRFNLVDGLVSPDRLVGSSAPFSLELTRDCVDVRRGVAGGLNPQNMHDRRISHHPTDGFVGTYEARIGFNQGQMVGLIRQYADSLGRKLSVLDAGCGYGSALLDLFEIDCVDREASFGVTLRTELVKREVRDRVFGGNFAFLEIDDDVSRFDLFFSVFGALYYHPIVQRKGYSYLYNFPFLHAVNMTKIGGLIFIDGSTLWGINVDDFVKMGVVEEIIPQKGCLKLLRRPSDDEIAQVLKLKGGVMPFDV